MQLNGLKTFEEDMSDVAGVKASYKAYNKFVKANGMQEKNKNIPLLSRQFTHEKLFFLSYAQVSDFLYFILSIITYFLFFLYLK